MIIILAQNKVAESHCRSFKDVWVELKDRYGYEFNTTVNGCIERIEFGNMTIAEAYVKGQKFPKLEVDSVRNMVRLETIAFLECQLDTVEPAAFRNVPRLKKVEISFCNLTNIQKGIFNVIENLEVLKLDHNQINSIEDQSFANLTLLRRVHVSYNNLTEWRKEWFKNSFRIETMDFQRNKISTIPKKAFASMKKLKQIRFDYNEISTIETGAFEGLNNLDHLRLKHNRLKVINDDIFPNPIAIRYLIVSANYLNFLSDDLLNKLSVIDILMDFNPWKCPCLDKIHHWINSKNVTLTTANHCNKSFVPVCAFSKTDSQSCLEKIDDELTERYLGILRDLPSPLEEWCARLD
ncbi:hypothetical protein JTB14_031799 [Gonioctena quinquepunctata]|nr:hypothetical protein JTB14_031799 [Gonioctena quinquepunctata]